MTDKKCNRCGKTKPIDEFYKDVKGKDGLYSRCKSCHNEQSRNWQKRNKDRCNELSRAWKKNNPEKVREMRRNYREENKEYIKEYMRRWREENPDYSKIYRQQNAEAYQKWREENRERINEVRRVYAQEQRKSNPLFKLSENYRNRIYKAFVNQGFSKNTKTEEMLGCDFETLKNHIESLMKEGMSWDNYGEWHVDHIIPLAYAETEEELVNLCHYKNLQPLWASENTSKSSNIALYTYGEEI